jgi:hypothetical protein
LRGSATACFEAILHRLLTAARWDVAGTLGKGSESTLRRRRDEWLAAGVFATLLAEAIAAYDRVIELRLERGRPRWQPAQSAHGRPEPVKPNETVGVRI